MLSDKIRADEVLILERPRRFRCGNTGFNCEVGQRVTFLRHEITNKQVLLDFGDGQAEWFHESVLCDFAPQGVLRIHGLDLQVETLFVLSECETWEGEWRSVGHFKTEELARRFRDARASELRESFDPSGGNTFEDWYSWNISEKRLLSESST